MKLRKKDFEVRKNFWFPRWRIFVFYGGVLISSGEGILEVRDESGSLVALVELVRLLQQSPQRVQKQAPW